MVAAEVLPGIDPQTHPLSLNSRAEIQKRAANGRITWKGPLTVIAARTVFIILAQLSITLIFFWLRSPDPWKAGTAWWQVTGTAVDIGCLALMFWFTRHEGIRLPDLFGLNRGKLFGDILLGLGLLIVIFPVVMIGGSMISGSIVYGTIQPALPAEVMSKSLPLWAAIFSRFLWWPIWSAVEEMTYNGYALPRIQVLLGGRTWLAVLIVGTVWAVQHSFLPFIPDWKVFLYLFIQMLPLVIVIQVLYLRFRRLLPTVVMHWGMDLFSAVMMITVV